jgi:hypothetical protein
MTVPCHFLVNGFSKKGAPNRVRPNTHGRSDYSSASHFGNAVLQKFTNVAYGRYTRAVRANAKVWRVLPYAEMRNTHPPASTLMQRKAQPAGKPAGIEMSAGRADQCDRPMECPPKSPPRPEKEAA